MNPFIESCESRLMFSTTGLLTAVQKQDLQTLGKDLTAIHAASDVTSAEVSAVTSDFASILSVAHAPSTASVEKLVTDAKSFFSDGKINVSQEVVLASDVQAVLSSAGVPTALAEQTASDVKAVIVSSNVTTEDVATIITDVRNLAATF